MITGIYWETIKSMHKEIIEEAIVDRGKDFISEGYRQKTSDSR